MLVLSFVKQDNYVTKLSTDLVTNYQVVTKPPEIIYLFFIQTKEY